MKNILVTSIFTLITLFSTAQTIKVDSTVTTYLHIKGQSAGAYQRSPQIVSFQLTNMDSLGNANWKSQVIKEFEKDKNDYFVKINVPFNLSKNSSQMWCTAKYLKSNGSKLDTIETKYGGVKLSNIKLILKSNPKGAETYLIPNRIWKSKFQNLQLDKNDLPIQQYRVNTSSTDTYAYVDETVFVVLFKMNNKYKQITHSTKPYNVEREQTVWIDF